MNESTRRRRLFGPTHAWVRRATLIAAVAMASASALVAQNVAAQEFPSIIKIVVPFGPGGSNDISARMLAKLLAPRIGKTVVVENRPGASGFIGAGAVALGPKDGSVLLLSSSSMVTAATIKAKPPVDILKDLAPVAILSESPLLIVVSSTSNIRTPADLLAAARANPDTVTNGTPGIGTIAHLTGELLNEMAKVQIKHVPYTGGNPAMIDLAAGRIDINVVSNSATASFVSQGRLRPIAVTTAKPNPEFPGVPTMDSVVPGFVVGQWQAVWAPAGTPAAIVERLNREIIEIVKTSDFAVLLRDDGGIAAALTPAQAEAKARETYELWRNLAKSKNLVVD